MSPLPKAHAEEVKLTLNEIQALGICIMLARETGGIGAFCQQQDSAEDSATFLASMRGALVKLTDAEARFPGVVPPTADERLQIAAARAHVEQEQAWLVDPGRGE